MNKIDILKQKSTFLNQLSNNEEALFNYINTNHDNLDEVIQQYKPEHEFKPVNTLRFLIANELKKGHKINAEVISQLKQAIENRDFSFYYNLNEVAKQSLLNYKQSKVGMFPNWKQVYKILFPFVHNLADNEEVKTFLNQLADDVISKNQFQNVTKHIVSFQGSQNYGSDHAWVAIIPESAPSVQYAYQMFFMIDVNGLSGGIHKGHNLLKQQFENQDLQFDTWEDYLNHIRKTKDHWTQLNSDINFLFINDEKAFEKAIRKVEKTSLLSYFKILDRLKEDLDIQDEEKLVFSVAKNRLSFQVGKRYCLNLNKQLFDFISYNEFDDELNGAKEIFSGYETAYLYKSRTVETVLNNYEEIKGAVATEIDRDNHALAKSYDNSAFRKAVFDKEYRSEMLNKLGLNIGINNINMENVKQEFVEWFFKLPKPKYSALNKENLINELDMSNAFFDRDIFSVSSSNYIDLIKYLKEKTNIKGSPFYQYSSKIFNHRPRALLGKENYSLFLKEKFKSSSFPNKTGYDASLNQIFYGPPGTGKTYNTILEAAKIITQNPDVSYTKALEVFNENLGDKIEFITFHQNYSYEDFIQGLRPDIEQKALSFNRADGVFAKIVTNALFEYYKVHQNNQKLPPNVIDIKIDLNDAFIEFLNSLEEGQEFETKTGAKIKVDNFTDRQNIEFRPINGVKSYLVSGNRLLKLYKIYDDIDKIKRVHEDIREAIGGCNSTIYYVALREFIDFLEKYKESVEEFVDDEENYDYENISYRRKKELLSKLSLDELRSVSSDEVPNYVIIIDEINRANISRVFGELITLIEKDKRSHGTIPLKATLPSGESFIVPSNLYIIGTMNTADKSIALLDIALRRRFEFKSMYPQYKIEGKKIHESEFLEKLNKLIVDSGKGHDFTIGHSYFMCDDNETFSFEDTINNKVIPLMLEYYMNAEGEVKKILKEAGVNIGNWPLKVLPND